MDYAAQFFPGEIELTDEHVKLAERLWLRADDSYYGGSVPSVDSKRPFGNSAWEQDVAEILGWELFVDANGEKHISKEQEKRAQRLLYEMGYVIKQAVREMFPTAWTKSIDRTMRRA